MRQHLLSLTCEITHKHRLIGQKYNHHTDVVSQASDILIKPCPGIHTTAQL